MRRCYRNVALLLGGILLVSNTFSNSCSVMTLNVHAAEDTLTEETAVSENIKITTKVRLSEHVTVSETVRGAENINTAKFTAQPDIQTGEENVETEIPADDSDSAPTAVVAEDRQIFELNDN